jgi:hypothetical protein
MGVCIMCGESTSNPFGLCSDECYENYQQAKYELDLELIQTVQIEDEDSERWTTVTTEDWGPDDVVVINPS